MVELELKSMQFDSRTCILQLPLYLTSFIGREGLLMESCAENKFCKVWKQHSVVLGDLLCTVKY